MYLDSDAPPAKIEPVAGQAPPRCGGAEYLAAKGQRLQRRRQAEARARQSAAAVEDRLKDMADSWRRLDPLPHALTNRRETMVWNGAFLLPKSKFGPFQAACDQLRGELTPGGLSVELTGPWPPYHFCPSFEPRDEDVPVPLQLLGISRSDEVASLGRGRSDAPFPGIHWVRQGFLTAATATTTATRRRRDNSPQAADRGPLEHARLLTAIHRHIGILPARYGAVLPDEEAVRQFLHGHGEELAGELDRLQGTAEMGLRIDLPHGPLPVERSTVTASGGFSPSELSPAAYLAARRARYCRHDQRLAEAQQTADTCLRVLKGLFCDWRRRLPEPPGTVRLAFLVRRERTADFTDRVETLESMRIGERCMLLGPWPPFSFV